MHLPSMCKALASTSSTGKQQNRVYSDFHWLMQRWQAFESWIPGFKFISNLGFHFVFFIYQVYQLEQIIKSQIRFSNWVISHSLAGLEEAFNWTSYEGQLTYCQAPVPNSYLFPFLFFPFAHSLIASITVHSSHNLCKSSKRNFCTNHGS